MNSFELRCACNALKDHLSWETIQTSRECTISHYVKRFGASRFIRQINNLAFSDVYGTTVSAIAKAKVDYYVWK